MSNPELVQYLHEYYAKLNQKVAYILTVRAARTDILSFVSDVRMCKDLCSSGCGGTSTFDDGVCDCRMPDNDEKGIECVERLIKRQNENLCLEQIATDQEKANRRTRCCSLKSRKQIRPDDVDRVINYFVKGGPMTGTPFVGSQRQDNVSSFAESKNSLKNNSKPVATRNMDLSVHKIAFSRKCDESVAPQEIKSPLISNTRLSARYQNDPVGSSPALHSHFSHPQNPSFPDVIPNSLLGIPQASANAAVPRSMELRYAPISGVSQNFHLPGRSFCPYFLGSPVVVADSQGILRNFNDHVSAYVPENDHLHMIGASQNQIINPYVEIPNAQLHGVKTSSYIPGLPSPMRRRTSVIDDSSVASQSDDMDNKKMAQRNRENYESVSRGTAEFTF